MKFAGKSEVAVIALIAAACLPNQLYVKIVAAGPGNSKVPDVVIG